MELLTPEKKELFGIYLGLAETVSEYSTLSKLKISKDTKVLGDKEELKDFSLYYGKLTELTIYNKELPNYNLSNSQSNVKYLESFSCFFTGCKSDITVLEVSVNDNFYIYIYSAIGDLKHHLDNSILSYNNGNLGIFLKEIIKYYLSKKYKKIVFCGHSNGMSSSVYISYVLSIITSYANPDDVGSDLILTKKNVEENMIKYLNVPKITDLYKGHVDLIRSKTFVCGTGGFPIIFRTQDEFNNYYSYINGSYVHIVKGIKTLMNKKVVIGLKKLIEKKEALLIDYYTLPDYDKCFHPPVHDKHKFKNFNTILFIDDMINKKIEIRNLKESDKNNLDYIRVLPDDKPHMCPVKFQHYYYELHTFKYYRNTLVPFFVDIEKLHKEVPIIPLISTSLETASTKVAEPLAESSAAAGYSSSTTELKYLKYKYKYLRLKMLKN